MRITRPMPPMDQTPPSSFLDKVGSVATAVVKHVPGRGVLWGFIGLVVGVVCVGLSFAIGVLVMDRGALILGYLAAIPMAIPFLGAALFFTHGLHRGAARAALELEQKFGLVEYVTTGVLSRLIKLLGGPVSNLPLQQVEEKLKIALGQHVKTSEGTGLAAWVVTRAKTSLTKSVETYLLAAYRAEQQADGSGGGVSLEKVGSRVSQELSGRLGDIVMAPLNKQLWIFMTLYVLVAAGWWFWLYLLVLLVSLLAAAKS